MPVTMSSSKIAAQMMVAAMVMVVTVESTSVSEVTTRTALYSVEKDEISAQTAMIFSPVSALPTQ